MILLDTNILGRITNSSDPQCSVSRNALDTLRRNGERLVIVPQNLFEFWAVATRPVGKGPGQNGLGMKIDQARAWSQFFLRRFILLPDRFELTTTWLSIVTKNAVSSHKAHDARLVAAMHTYNVTKILTFNSTDFSPFGVTVLDPRNV